MEITIEMLIWIGAIASILFIVGIFVCEVVNSFTVEDIEPESEDLNKISRDFWGKDEN